MSATADDNLDSDSPPSARQSTIAGHLGSLVRAVRSGAARNTLWLLCDRLVRLLLGFLVSAWVARYLGIEDFGRYSYVVAFILLFQMIATLGVELITVRDLARDADLAPELLGTVLRLRILAGLASWVCAIGISLAVDGASELTLMVAIAGATLVFQAADTIDLWFQSNLQSRRTVVAKLLAYLFAAALRIAFIFASMPLIAFVIAYVLEGALAAIALKISYRSFRTPRTWTVEAGRALALLRQSWPFLAANLSNLISLRIDQIMLRHLGSDRELGVFAAIIPISMIATVIPMTVIASLAPVAARRRDVSMASYNELLLWTYRGFGLASLLMAVGMAVFADWIVHTLYGPQFAESAEVLRIYAFTNVFLALGVAQSLWITNEGAGTINLYKTATGCVISIVGNWLVIPHYGAVGAAWVALVAFLVSNVLTNLVLAPQVFLNQLGIRGILPYAPLVRLKTNGVSDPAA